MQLVDSAYSTFTKPELERLAAYRAAVAAGFYTDWDGSTTSADTEVLAWLRAADGFGSDRGVSIHGRRAAATRALSRRGREWCVQ